MWVICFIKTISSATHGGCLCDTETEAEFWSEIPCIYTLFSVHPCLFLWRFYLIPTSEWSLISLWPWSSDITPLSVRCESQCLKESLQVVYKFTMYGIANLCAPVNKPISKIHNVNFCFSPEVFRELCFTNGARPSTCIFIYLCCFVFLSSRYHALAEWKGKWRHWPFPKIPRNWNIQYSCISPTGKLDLCNFPDSYQEGPDKAWVSRTQCMFKIFFAKRTARR